MVHVLGDGAVLKCNGNKVEAVYFEEMPLEYFNMRFRGKSRFFVAFGYANQRQPYPDSINGGTLFGALLWHYPGKCMSDVHADSTIEGPTLDSDGFPQVQAKELLLLGETLHTKWDVPLIRQQVADFMAIRVKKALTGESISPFQHGEGVHLDAPRILPLGNNGVTKRWGPGEVDLLVKNIGTERLTLRRIPIGEPIAEQTPQLTEGMDEIAIAESSSIVFLPGEGRRIFTEEKERWQILRDSEVVQRYTVDVAYGVVQDLLIGGPDKLSDSLCEQDSTKCETKTV
jgi:hypothetical protein